MSNGTFSLIEYPARFFTSASIVEEIEDYLLIIRWSRTSRSERSNSTGTETHRRLKQKNLVENKLPAYKS
jgi:hypothetical protein